MDDLKREPEDRSAGEVRTGDQPEACDTVQDPVRRGLCKICNKPVVGELPFCQDHEPEVP